MNCILKGTIIKLLKDINQAKLERQKSDLNSSNQLRNIVNEAQLGFYIIDKDVKPTKNEETKDSIFHQASFQRLILQKKVAKLTKKSFLGLSGYLYQSYFIENDWAQSGSNCKADHTLSSIFFNAAKYPRFLEDCKQKFLPYIKIDDEQWSHKLSLRGGGCGQSQLEKRIQKQQEESLKFGKLPSYFICDFVKYINIIISKAELASDEKQKEELLLAIQWFTLMREYFNTLCVDNKSASSIYDLIFSFIPQLLKSSVIYLRISGFLCIQILQIINDLCRIIFTFFMKNNQRFLKVQDKEYFEELVQDFETQLDIEASNIWIAGAEFEITMIKAVIQNSPSNSNEGKELVISFLQGLVESVITMSPTLDLIDSLIGGAKFLYQAYQGEDLKKKYEVYYYFESLKWQIIQLLRQDVSIKKVMQLLRSGFLNYVENSNDWLLNFCWVKMIASLISYRPIISKQDIQRNKVEQQQRWNQLIKYKFIAPLSFNSNLGRLLLCQNIKNQETPPLNQLMQNLGIKNFSLFSEVLLKNLDYSSANIFKFIEKGQQQQIKIDYLYDVLFGNHQLEESIEQLNQLQIRYEQIYLKIKQGYEKYKIPLKADKEKQKQMEEIIENFKEIMKQSFCIFSFNSNVYKIFLLYFERFSIILNAIIIKNSEQEQLITNIQQSIFTIEQLFYEKCLEGLQRLQNEKKNIITSLTTVEVFLEKSNNQQDSNQQITKQFEIIVTFSNSIKFMKSQYIIVLEKINEMKKLNSQYKQNQIQMFNQKGNLKKLEQLAQKLINQNHFKSEALIVNELFQQAISKLGDWSNKLINYNSLKYFLVDFTNQMNETKEQIEQMIKFIQRNKSSLQVLQQSSSTISSSDIKINNYNLVNDMLWKQQSILSQFFSQEETQLSSGKTGDSISGEQILQLLKNDSEQLQQMQSQQQNDLSLKPIRYAVAMVEQFLNKYLKTPQKFHSVQVQILEIYSQLKLKQEGEKGVQSVQPQQEKQRKNLNPSQKIENILMKLMNLTDIIMTTLTKCQIILEGIVDKITLYENIQQIEMQLDYQAENGGLLSLMYEENENLNILEHIIFLTEMEVEFKDSNDDFHESMGQIFECAGLLQIQLLFCDFIRPKLSIYPNVDMNIIQAAQSFLQDMFDNINQGLEDQNYKVRQCYAISLISTQVTSQEQNLVKFCQDCIVQIWATEKDERVKALLKNSELIQIQKSLFSSDLQSFSKRLQLDMEEKLNKLNELEQKIYLEGDSSVRLQMQEQLQAEQFEFEDYLDNINHMAGKLDIGIQFLKDIKRSLTQLKYKIDKLQDTIHEIGDDIRKLRGKNYNQLLNIRKRKVLEQMQQSSLNQIYIPLQCQEWDPVTGKPIGIPSILLNDNFKNQVGEINEFLQKDQSDKDVLLLRGLAGSGKSRAAGKIEEFLWQKLDQKESTWIPIYVSLPTLKEPKFNLFDQALESDFYQFDKIQVKEFKEAIELENLKIILILDSYDEMKYDCIQSNLYQTNRFQKDLFGSIQDVKQVKQQLKLIITTRTEILTSSSYQTQFYGETIESLKEVELLGFDEDQQQRYLEQYTQLNLKKEFLDLYYFGNSMQKQKIIVQEFCQFWKKISDYLIKIHNNQNEDQLINEKMARSIISIVKIEKIFQKITQDQIINLEKKIMDLWGPQKFQKLIIGAQIQHILTTPFMMEIVVQVLPSMTKKYSDSSSFKEKFINSFVQIKLESQIEQSQIQLYQNKRLILSGLQAINDIAQDFTQADFKDKALKIWDQLQNEKYLQKFSLVDKIKKTDLLTIEDSVVVIRALIVKQLTVFDFYLTFVEFYHSQQIKKQQELGKMINYESLMIDLFNFSQSLAINLTINELTQIKYISKGQLNLQFVEADKNQEHDWQDVYFNDFKDNGEYKKLIRSCILLTSKGGSNSFTHKSIQEFYVGHFLLKILDARKILDNDDFSSQLSTYQWEVTCEKLKQKETSQFVLTKMEQFCSLISNSLLNKNKFNISSDNYKGVLSLIKEEMKQKPHFKPKLLQIMKLSQISKEFIRASSNSLFLLGYNNDFLGFQQLQYLRISDIDMDGVSFYGSNLTNSEFKNVSIRSCNFNNANLMNALWTDIKCDELHGLYSHTGAIDYLVFSHNGQYLVSIGNQDFSLRLWSIQEGKQILKYQFADLKKLNQFGKEVDYFKLERVLFSNNDQILGLGWYSERLEGVNKENYATQLLDFDTGKSLGFELQSNQKVKTMLFTNDGKFFASCNKSSSISLQSVSHNNLDILQGHSEEVNSILFTEDDQILVSCSQDKLIKFWDYKDKKVIAQLEGHESSIENIVLSPSGQILASCSDKLIKLWNIQTYQLLFNLEGHKEQIFKLKFLSDGQTLISWGLENMILFWGVKEGRQIRCIERTNKEYTDPICISSDDQLLAQQNQNEIQLWDIQVGKIISVIGGQSKKVVAMGFQPGNLLLTSVGAGEKVIQLWNAKIQKNTSHLDGHKKEVNFIGFSPDNKILFSASKDETIRLWDLKEGKPLQSLNNIKNCSSVEFSKKGEFIFIQSDLIYLWYFKEGRLVSFKEEEFTQTYEIKDIAIQPYGDILAWCSSDYSSNKTSAETKIKFYNLKEQNEVAILKIKSKSINKLKFSPDGLFLVSVGSDNKAQLWDMKKYLSIVTLEDVSNIIFSPNSQVICTFNFSQKQGARLLNQEGVEIGLIEKTKQMKFSPTSQILASIFEKSICLWNVKDGKQLATLTGHKKDAEDFQFSPDGSLIALYAYDKLIYLWDTKTLQELKVLDSQKSRIRGMTFSGNNKFLVTYNYECQIIIWDHKQGMQLTVLEQAHSAATYETIFSPDDQLLLSCDQDFKITIWDVNTWTKIASNKNYYHEYSTLCDSIAFSPNSQKIAMCSKRAIKLQNLKEGKEPELLLGHEQNVNKILFSNDGSILVSKDQDHKYLILWDCEKCELIKYLAGDNADQKQLLLSNDDKKLASYVGDGKIRLYETDFGQKIATIDGHKHLIQQITFSPDSCYLASCSLDFTIILWDVNKLKQMAILEGHTDFINQIVFSPDSCLLISGSSSMTMKVWDVKNLKSISELKNKKALDSLKEIVFSPDGKQVALCTSQKLHIWNLVEGSQPIQLEADGQRMLKIYGFVPGGELLITYGDYEIYVWNIKQKKLLLKKPGQRNQNCKLNQDGKLLFLLGGTGGVYISDLQKNLQIANYQEHTNSINQIALSTDDLLMATCSNDSTVKLSYISQLNELQDQKEKIMSSYKTLAIYAPITAQNCLIQGATIILKIGWNLKQLFLQKGAREE